MQLPQDFPFCQSTSLNGKGTGWEARRPVCFVLLRLSFLFRAFGRLRQIISKRLYNCKEPQAHDSHGSLEPYQSRIKFTKRLKSRRGWPRARPVRNTYCFPISKPYFVVLIEIRSPKLTSQHMCVYRFVHIYANIYINIEI